MQIQHTDDLSPEARRIPRPPVVMSVPTPLQTTDTPVVTHLNITTSLVYHVDSVEKTEAPGGGQDQDWYRYVLTSYRSTINGLRRGTRQHVCDYAAQYAEQLNSRIIFGAPRWSPHGSKIAPRSR